MKQYTTTEQTAKLIEMGLADSVREERYKRGSLPKNYSIGELIEMLPSYVEWKGNYYDLRIEIDRTYTWIAYEPTKNDKAKILPVYDCGSCLIDILYNVLINLVALKDELTDAGGHNEYNQGEVLSEVFKLKEEGVI